MNETSRLQRTRRGFARLGKGVLLAASATLMVLSSSMDAWAMDTDIFAATSSSTTAPNVLIVLDNSSNWSRQSQHFPGGITQGQAEVDAIKTAISTLPGHINIGVMEYPTGGNDSGGFIRFAISPMGSDDGTTGTTNRTNLSTQLTTIYNNITDPTEKVNQGLPYGDLMRDAYNYLTGSTPYASSGNVVAAKADSNGYTTNYTRFKSPLSSGGCGTTYIIFIGNPPANGPANDSAGNLSALSTAGGDTKQLDLPNYVKSTQALADNIGYSGSCYTSTPSSTTDSVYQTCAASVTAGTYTSCSYNANDQSTVLSTCSSGSRYAVVQSTPVVTGTTTTSTSTATGTTSSCYYNTSSWSASTDTGTVGACAASSTTTSGSTTTTTNNSCTYSVTATGQTTSGCSNVSNAVAGSAATSTSLSTSCYANTNSWSSSDTGGLSCPATTSSTSNGITTTTTYSCSYTAADSGQTSKTVSGVTTTCGNNKTFMTVTQTASPTTTTSGQQYKFPITKTTTTTTTTGTQTGTSNTTLGNTLSCYASLAACSTSDYTCATGSTCSCSTPATTTGTCPAGARYQVQGNYSKLLDTATGTFTTDTATYNADEWARFLHDTGVPVGTSKAYVSTYTIDVYNLQPDATQSALLSSMARNGGGKYFAATSEAAILSALQNIFAEVQAVNNTFASAALPISATNRAQNSNQVYIGMFRPDQGDHPRWFGNLKRYEVAKLAGFDGLAGQDHQAAVSNTTGFITPCAKSYWTTSSTGYWFDTTLDKSRIFITQATSGNAGTAWDSAGNDDNFAKGTCDTSTQWDDLPDGPTVEKGGAAQMLRNNFVNRKLYTIASTSTNSASLLTFSTSTTGLSSNSTINTNIANFIMGQDVTGEVSLTASTSARPSIHGDVIHSRPLPVDHGGTTGVVVYYGAGDGVYHAVQGSTGQELWGFVAPENYSSLQRLMDNTPLVLTPNPTPPNENAISGTTGRDFFFDGSTGVYQNAANTKVWIYPAMRRGGRMLYAFDVSSPSSPSLLWRRGCFDQSSDTNCTTGMSGIGQTWSTPQLAAKVNGYKDGSGNYKPVVIVGGGYDTCEDADSTSPSCSSPKGSVVYVLDAQDGTLLKAFTTSTATNSGSGPSGRSIAADVALVDTNGDGAVDYAYAADTGGNLYRIDFPSNATGASDWSMKKVAYTNVTTSDSHRKFLFAPAVLPYQGSIFVAIVSGDREHPLALSYPYTTPVLNRAYLYLDDPTRSGATDLDGNKMIDESAAAPDCNSTKVLPGGTNYGWHMDLKAACTASANGCGEQGVTSALIFGGMVTWSTNRPTGAGETCSSSLGEARGYFVNLLNGSGAIGVSGTCGGTTSSVFPGGGLPPSAVAATVNVDGKEETVLIGAPCKDGTSCAPIQAQQLSPPISSTRSRTYWKLNTDNK